MDKLDEQLNEVVEQVSSENDIDDAEKWKLGLAGRLIQLGVPSPWPATLCRLATSTDVAESTGELSESLRSDDTTCDAIIAVVKAALSKQLAADDFGDAVGLKGLSKDAHVLVSVTSEVGDVGMSQVWRKAQAESIRSDGLIGPHTTTITVDAPKAPGKSPTITLKKGYTYEVEWTTTPEPGEYVISELAVGGKYGQVQIAKEAGSKAVGSFANPPEAYLTVAMREGSGTREFSAAEIARGEVLVMPFPNPTVSSGAGAVLREAAATGNLKLLKALLDVGVSVWEADPTATTAVHLAARNGQEETFDLLWRVPPKEDVARSKLVGPTMAFVTLRNNDSKRALDFIFESGSAKLARLTRGDASDEELKKLKEEEPEALKWTVRRQPFEPPVLRCTGALNPHMRMRILPAPGRMHCSRSSARRSAAGSNRRGRPPENRGRKEASAVPRPESTAPSRSALPRTRTCFAILPKRSPRVASPP